MQTQQDRTEQIALDLAVRYEQSQARTVTYCGDGYPSPKLCHEVRVWVEARHPGAPRPSYDLLSRDSNGDIARLIEVKGRGGDSTSISILDRQRNSMLALGSDWWLYVGLDCVTAAPYLVVVEEPARLPWKLVTPERDLDEGQRRRVGDEGLWHVMPGDVLAAGVRIDPAAQPA